MMPEVTSPEQKPSAESQELKSFFVGVGVGVVVLTLLLVVGGTLLAIFADEAAAEMEIIRDAFISALALQFVIIGTAITVLLIQSARLVNLVSNEVEPILESASQTVNTVKGTAEFVSKNVTEPVLSATATMRTIKKTMTDVNAIQKAIGIAMTAVQTATDANPGSSNSGGESASRNVKTDTPPE